MKYRSRWKPQLHAAALTLIGLATIEGAHAQSSADAFPYDLAFRAKKFPYNTAPVASPAGDWIAFEVVTPPENQPQDDRFQPDGTPVKVTGSQIHVVSSEGKITQEEVICAQHGDQWAPRWSPDGKQIAFYSNADGRVHLWTYQLASRTCKRVSDAIVRGSVFSGSEPRWSADGSTLYVPLDPHPPTQQPPAANDAESRKEPAKAKPLVFFGGGEGGPTKETTKLGSSDEFMMRHYNTTLAAITLTDGRPRIVVPAADSSRPNRLEVSPSGRWISYQSVIYPAQEIATDYLSDLFVVPAAGGPSASIVKGLRSSEHNVNYTRLDYRWHPTADRLFYLKDGGLWEVNFTADGAGAPQRKATALGELAPAVLYFTRDGKQVLVGTAPKGVGRDRAPQGLALVPLDGGEPRRLTLPAESKWQFLDLVRADENVLWQPDAGAVSVLLRERATGRQSTLRIQVASDQSTHIASGMFRNISFAAGGDHARLTGVYEDIGRPPNLYRFNNDVARGQRLSVIDPRLEGRRYGTSQVLETRTPQHDGSMASVRTTLLLPPGAKKGDRLPGIVMIYSGSDLSTRASYFGGGMGNTVPSQIFTSRGYAVIMANIVLAQEGIPSHPAEQMTDEVLAQAYAVAEAGYVDINRLAVSGQSYGGYSTASIVSHTNLFRAAIPVNGTFDLASFYGGMDDSGNSHWIRWAEKGQGRMGEHPWMNPARYIDNSPYYRADRIRTPLLIVAGEKDSTVPYTEAKKLFVGLRRMDRPVQLAIYPGEGHVIATWSTANAVDVSERMIQFLDKHLAKSAAP